MKKILFLIFACFLLAPSLALADDSSPMSFYGLAELNGRPLPEGSVVQLLAAGVSVGKAMVDKNGNYNESDYAKSRLIVSEYKGNELVFKYISQEDGGAYLGDTVIKYLGAFEAGRNVNFDLPFVFNASLSFIPVTATATIAKIASGTIQVFKKNTQILGEKIINYSAFQSLSGLDSSLANAISQNEADTISGQNEMSKLSAENNLIYDKIVAAHLSGLSENDKKAIAYFIQSGTPTTKRLGDGERAGALNSFMSAFGRAPVSSADWQDVIKIANGRWLAQTNQVAEDEARLKFKKAYLRAPDMENKNDQAAVTVIAYGLRPASRNLNSEKTAINSFKYIFKKSPASANDWDIIRAIAYSGAKR
jgi:hypothetical protein